MYVRLERHVGGPKRCDGQTGWFDEPIRLTDGTPARLRALVGTDRQVIQDIYTALSQVSRRSPFSPHRRG